MLLENSVQRLKISLQIKKLVKLSLIFLLLLSSLDILSDPANIQGIRFWQSPDKTRVVFGT